MDTLQKTISQKDFRGGELFCFHDDHLAYFSDRNDFRIKYLNLPDPKTCTHPSRMAPVSRGMIIYCAIIFFILMVRMGLAHIEGEELFRRIVLVLTVMSVLCAATYFLLQENKKHSRLQTWKGAILVAQDKVHDAVMEEIRLRRLRALREKYLPVDPADTPEARINTLRALKDMGAISEEEYLRHCAGIAG